MNLRNKLRRWLFPEMFDGRPQPHERQDLASGPAIEEARRRGMLEVGLVTMTPRIDGERALLDFSNGNKLWVDADGADALAHVLVGIAQEIRIQKSPRAEFDPTGTQGIRASDAIDIHGYSFLVRSSKGMFRFDKRLDGAFLNPGQDVAYATIQFAISPEGEIITGEGWERAL